MANQPAVCTSVAGLRRAPPKLLKLDVQGYEYEVLSGAKQTLKDIDVILTEVNLIDLYKGAHLLDDLIALLRKLQAAHVALSHEGRELVQLRAQTPKQPVRGLTLGASYFLLRPQAGDPTRDHLVVGAGLLGGSLRLGGVGRSARKAGPAL